jgi:Sulfotransferase domain
MNNADSPVFIASYPRSGNTLVRTVLFHCFGLKSGSVHSNDFHGNKKLEQYVGHIELHSDGSHFPIGTIPLIKTHKLPDPADQSPVIYVVRDGRAACLSLYYFCNERIPLAEIITGQARVGPWHLAKWSDHILAWNPWGRLNTVLIRYEDLADALPGVVQRLSQFLNRKPIGDKIPPRDEIAAVDGRWVRSGSHRDGSFPAELADLF